MSDNKIYNMDAIEGMRKYVKDKSVDLVCIDPPYNIKKAEWDKWKNVNDYVEWMGEVFKECERVLKDNGSFYFFHNDFLQIVDLQNWISKNTEFVFKQLIIWDKYNGSEWNQLNAIVHSDENRNYSKQAEYCLFYTFQYETGLSQVYDSKNCFRTIKDYLKTERDALGLSTKKLAEKIGTYREHIKHYMIDSQWSFPTKEMYEKLQTTGRFKRPYEELRQEYESLRQEYESLRYTFNNQKLPSVWLHPPMKQNGHITPKPLEIIENIIKTSSNENDVVLDCFLGSGTTALACSRLKRNFVGFEISPEYIALAEKRLKEEI